MPSVPSSVPPTHAPRPPSWRSSGRTSSLQGSYGFSRRDANGVAGIGDGADSQSPYIFSGIDLGVIDLDRDTTFAEDLALVKDVQRGLGSRGYRPGPLVRDPDCGVMSEHSIAKLQQWMREAVSP